MYGSTHKDHTTLIHDRLMLIVCGLIDELHALSCMNWSVAMYVGYAFEA